MPALFFHFGRKFFKNILHKVRKLDLCIITSFVTIKNGTTILIGVVILEPGVFKSLLGSPTFDKDVFTVPDKAARTVCYACKETILAAVNEVFPAPKEPEETSDKAQGGNVTVEQAMDRRHQTAVRTSA